MERSELGVKILPENWIRSQRWSFWSIIRTGVESDPYLEFFNGDGVDAESRFCQKFGSETGV